MLNDYTSFMLNERKRTYNSLNSISRIQNFIKQGISLNYSFFFGKLLSKCISATSKSSWMTHKNHIHQVRTYFLSFSDSKPSRQRRIESYGSNPKILISQRTYELFIIHWDY